MSATSAEQGRGLDVDLEPHPGPGSAQAHSAAKPSLDIASPSSVSADAVESTDRPSTAVKFSPSTEQIDTSPSKSRSSLEQPEEQKATSPALDQGSVKVSQGEALKRDFRQASKQPTTKKSKQSLKRDSKQDSPSAEPSGPVLVNPAPANILNPSSSSTRNRNNSSSIMHIPLSPHSLTHPALRPQKHIGQPPRSLPSAPSPAAFSFTSILSSLSIDPATQSDIDAIAEICGRSRLSMANEYGAHREPVGAGPGAADAVRIGEDGTETAEEDYEGASGRTEQQQRLVLDTGGAAAHRASPVAAAGANATAGGLETVGEAPTPLSERSQHRIGEGGDGGAGRDTYNSNTANPSCSPTAASAVTSSTDVDPSLEGGGSTPGRWGFLDVWERGATRLGKGKGQVVSEGGTAAMKTTGVGVGQSVLGLGGMEVEALGEGVARYGAEDPGGELRDDITGARGSRAVRQLMRVAGA